jgi:uncharacterized protein YacL
MLCNKIDFLLYACNNRRVIQHLKNYLKSSFKEPYAWVVYAYTAVGFLAASGFFMADARPFCGFEDCFVNSKSDFEHTLANICFIFIIFFLVLCVSQLIYSWKNFLRKQQKQKIIALKIGLTIVLSLALTCIFFYF